ncbi:hypothetical protein DVS28_b0577 (plasmid) [Euzebya pacifica]|uniref:Uncharacterized protein n=2 Tax=Euzebya pacifica TaxID=1608957 RepID=A0A346Y770_9ACTN|nr:hypothetical protein DVS28_b0577 [Euzebya pacifica]
MAAATDPMAEVIPFPSGAAPEPTARNRPRVRRDPRLDDARIGGRPMAEIAALPPTPDRLTRPPVVMRRGKAVVDRSRDWKPGVFRRLGFDTPEQLAELNGRWSGYFSADDIATCEESGIAPQVALERVAQTAEMINKAQAMMRAAAEKAGVTPSELDPDIDQWLFWAALTFRTTDPEQRGRSVTQYALTVNEGGMLGWDLNRRILEAVVRHGPGAA